MRDTFFDSLKFILIFLVILGHYTAICINDNRTNLAVTNFLYIFHMPLFIFASGFFFKKINYKKLTVKLLYLFETFIVFQAFYILIKIIMLGIESIHLKDIIHPQYTLWYIVSFISWMIITNATCKYINNFTFLLLSILISLFIGFIPYFGPSFSLSRTFVFLPFFVLGYISNNEIIDKIRKIPKIISIIYLTIIIIILYIIDNNFIPITTATRSFYHLPYDFHILFISRCIFMILAVITSIAFINISIDNNLFSTLGKNTKIYYLYHGFIVKFITLMLVKNLYISDNIIILLFFSFFTIFIIYFWSKFKISSFLLNPFSITYKKIRSLPNNCRI